MIDPLPSGYRRTISPLPNALADAGFGLMVAGVAPLQYRIVIGGLFHCRKPDAIQSPIGSMAACIAWGMSWLEQQRGYTQQSFL